MSGDWYVFLALFHCLTRQLVDQATPNVPPVVAGLLCSLLPPLHELTDIRQNLSKQLRHIANQAVWFQNAELAEVCAVLDGLHTYDPSLITGSDMAAFIERLVASEASVGGPYVESDGTLHASTNGFVNQTLAWVAEALPNVTAFLAQASPHFTNRWLSQAEKTLLCILDSNPDVRPTHLQQLQTYSHLFIAAVAARILYEASQQQTASDALVVHAQAVYARSRLFTDTPQPFASKTSTMLNSVIQVDNNHEIAALAWMYGQATGHTGSAAQAACEHLGIANVYAWAAYTIYDDFLDDEGEPSLLATANYCLRAMLREYRTALPAASFQLFVEETLAIVDAANTYETTQLRFSATASSITVGRLPDYGTAELLANRALFHIIGPMGVLAASGEDIGSSTWIKTLQAFRHYLIARQLNDDIHDWVKDLQRGQISYVVAAVLRYLGTPPGTYSLDELIAYARLIFWQTVLPGICDTALEHITAAKRMPCANPAVFEQSELMRLFNHVESSMHAAKQQRVVSQDFVRQLNL